MAVRSQVWWINPSRLTVSHQSEQVLKQLIDSDNKIMQQTPFKPDKEEQYIGSFSSFIFLIVLVFQVEVSRRQRPDPSASSLQHDGTYLGQRTGLHRSGPRRPVQIQVGS